MKKLLAMGMLFFVLISWAFLPNMARATETPKKSRIDEIVDSADEQKKSFDEQKRLIVDLQDKTGVLCWMIPEAPYIPLLEKLTWHPDVLKVVRTLRDRGIVIGISNYGGGGIRVENGSVYIGADMAYYMSGIRKFLGLNPYLPYWEYK